MTAPGRTNRITVPSTKRNEMNDTSITAKSASRGNCDGSKLRMLVRSKSVTHASWRSFG
jgi:hypothetical protein